MSNVSASTPAVTGAAGAAPTRVAGRYVLLDKLGSGGMGAVYRALDESSGRIVAFKQLLASLAGSKRRTLELLFEREYHTLVRLKHPRIIEVYDYGLSESGPYYTMELLDGEDLQHLAPLPYRQACRCLRDVASSLALIHAHRLLHRDLSPRNVRLTHDGRAKLIDFGALATFGPSEALVGTPLCMAPEILQRLPLDQRTDLYAVGATGYWALTGRHAYPARRIEDLPVAWQRAPAAPSKLVADIPPELDALILSLLNLNPLARPASAAAVIDRLTAIAELEAEEHDHTAESYLASGRMVGRASESEWLQKRVARARDGHGSEIVAEGPAGIGRTRLLYELCLEGMLRGAAVLRADAQASPGPFGVAAALAASLINALPEIARSAAQPHAALLGHLSAELHDKLEQPQLAALVKDPRERRLRFQTALYEWFLAVAQKQTLFIAVDDLQAADDSSVAFLAALGREARNTHLLMLLTQRTGDAVAAPIAIEALRKGASRLKVSALDSAACEELVQGFFGSVANTGRLARLLYEKSAGNPQRCIDLVQLLVKKKIASYVAGTWVLPLDVSSDELPSRMEEILAVKIASLSHGARELAEALSIDPKPVSIEHCVSLAAAGGEQAAYAALDELVAEQVLLAEGDRYRFGHEALREALLAQMDAAHRRAKHLHAAETLLARAGDNLKQRMEAGWHLLHAGEELRGAELLAATSRAFHKSEGAGESPAELVRAMRSAVEIYERHGRSEHELAQLLLPLVPLAFYSADWRFVVANCERIFRLGLKITGLSLAQKLRPLLGRKLALRLGLFVGRLGFRRQQRRGLVYDPSEAIAAICSMVPAAIGTLSIALDAAGTARVRQILAPLRLFGEDHLASVMCHHIDGAAKTVCGLEWEAREHYERVVQRLREPRFRAIVGEGHWPSMFGGVLFGRALMDCYCSDARALEAASELETLGVRVWAMSAAQVRLLYHALRGESEQVQQQRERAELFAVQGSTTWQAELFLPVVMLNADVLSADTIGARRTSEQIARQVMGTESLRIQAEAARAAYLALRGDLAGAIALYDQVLPEFAPRACKSWLNTRAYFAAALNTAGQHARAKQVASEAISHLKPQDLQGSGFILEPKRQLALAEAGLGQHQAAVRALDKLLALHGHEGNPLLVGLLHKARAEVALRMADKPAFEQHVAEMTSRFHGTNNPALIAQVERLNARAVEGGLLDSKAPSAQDEGAPWRPTALSAHRTFAELTIAADRYGYALQLMMERAHAKSGYLYLFEQTGMRLVAASGPNEPPIQLETQLHGLCVRSHGVQAIEEDEQATVVELGSGASSRAAAHDHPGPGTQAQPSLSSASIEDTNHRAKPDMARELLDSAMLDAEQATHRSLVLRLCREAKTTVVGGAILEMEMRHLIGLGPELLEAVARALYDR